MPNIPQPRIRTTHTCGHPSIRASIRACIPISRGTPIHGNAFPYTWVPPSFGMQSPSFLRPSPLQNQPFAHWNLNWNHHPKPSPPCQTTPTCPHPPIPPPTPPIHPPTHPQTHTQQTHTKSPPNATSHHSHSPLATHSHNEPSIQIRPWPPPPRNVSKERKPVPKRGRSG